MPGKKKKSSKNRKNGGVDLKIRDLELKEALEEYGKVVLLRGDCKITVKFPDGSEVLGIIPRRMKRRCWIAMDSVVLVSIRSFQDGKVDVIHKYTDDEVKKLIQYSEIPEWFGKSSTMFDDTVVDDGIDFREDIITEEDPSVIDFDDI